MLLRAKSVDQRRLEFVLEAIDHQQAFSRVCRAYGVSRKTGYKWVSRYKAEGLYGLVDRSRRPHHRPFSTSSEMVCEVIRYRLLDKYLGPKKIQELLLRRYRKDEVPAISTIAKLLRDSGLVEVKSRSTVSSAVRLTRDIEVSGPNDLWTVDFKGWWKTRDGRRCEPLVIRDQYSRYVLEMRAMHKIDTASVRAVFEEVFDRYGLPLAIRSDNGSPFASRQGLCGLTRLSVWWLSLGIGLDRSRPGKPQDNGSHERFHRDVKAQVQSLNADTLVAQQEALDVWRDKFNHARPHEAIEMKFPAQLYKRSAMEYTKDPKGFEYPDGWQARKVSYRGFIRINGKEYFVSEALRGYYLGIRAREHEQVEIWFNQMCLGMTDKDFSQPLSPMASAAEKN